MDRVAAIVLAGSRGEDFGCLAEERTKAAFPVAGYYRIIDFALSNLSHTGVRQVGIVIHYLPSSLLAHIGSGRAWDFDMADRSLNFMTPFVGISETRWFNGSADAIAKGIDHLELAAIDEILILSGENIYQMDYHDLVSDHRRAGADVTVACVRMPPERQHPRFGNVIATSDGRIEQYVEKPERSCSPNVSMGIYCFRREVLIDLLEAARPPGGVEFRLAADILQPTMDRLNGHAWFFHDPWHYIVDPREYHQLHMQLARGESDILGGPRHVLTNFSDRDLGSRPPAYFSRDSRVENSIVSPGCRIEGTVLNSVLSPGVRLGRGALVSDSVVFHDVRIGKECRIENVICDKDATFEKGSKVGGVIEPEPGLEEAPPLTIVPKGQVVGEGETIAAGSTLARLSLI